MKISIDSIDTADDFYRTSYFSDFSALQQSLQAVGQVQPVRLEKQMDGTLRVISGFRRIWAAQQLGWTSLEAEVISVPASEQFSLFRQTLFENFSLRPLNWVEKAFVALKLKNQFQVPDEALVRNWFPALQIGQNRRWLAWLLPIPEYEPDVQRAIAEDALTFDLFEFLPELDSESRQTLVGLFQTLKLGKNRQKEFFSLLRDVALRERISIGVLLKRDELGKILQAENTSLGQKTQQVRDVLRRWRYPHLVATEARFRHMVRDLRLPPGIQLRPPPNFEGDKFRLDFAFRTAEEFARIVVKLQEVATSGKLDALRQLWEEE